MSSPAQGYHSEATTTFSWKAECALWIKEQLEDGFEKLVMNLGLSNFYMYDLGRILLLLSKIDFIF